MIPGTKDRDHVIGLLGQTKKLRPESLLHFSGGFVGEGQGYNLRDRQGVWLSQEEIEDTIDENGGLAGAGSRDYHDIAIPGCLGQKPSPGIYKRRCITHRVLSVFSGGVILGPVATDRNATMPWHRGVGRQRKIRSARNNRPGE